MAAYAATVTTPMNGPERISRSLGVLAGKVSISNYNAILAEITGITRYFKTGGIAGFTSGIISVACEGFTSNGYLARWNPTDKAFDCFYAKNIAAVSIPVDSNVASGAALLFGSGGGAAALHATSAVGNITMTVSAGVAVEVADDVDIGDVTFLAVGFI